MNDEEFLRWQAEHFEKFMKRYPPFFQKSAEKFWLQFFAPRFREYYEKMKEEEKE